jgi:hypothetical protein
LETKKLSAMALTALLLAAFNAGAPPPSLELELGESTATFKLLTGGRVVASSSQTFLQASALASLHCYTAS